MKKILKGVLICSLTIVLGKQVFFKHTINEYNVESDIKSEKGEYRVDLLPDACVTEETVIDTLNNVKLGDLKPILIYKKGEEEIDECDNMGNPILTIVDNCDLEGWYYDKALTQKAEGVVIGDIMQTNPVNKTVVGANCITKYEYITYVYAKCNTPTPTPTPVCPTDTVNTYTVSYVVDNAVISKNIETAGGKLNTLNPTKEGYVFDGWYIDADLKTKFDGTITLTKKYDVNNCFVAYEDVVLYGKWVKSDITCNLVEKDFLVIFNTNGGNTINSLQINNTTDGTKEIQIPIKEGYEFNGWYLDEKLTQKANYKIINDINTEKYIDANGCVVGYKNVTLYAAWSKKTDNPNTSDNIIIYIGLGILLLVGFASVTKKLNNN